MTARTASDVTSAIAAHIAAGANGTAAEIPDLVDDLDLLESGLLDSFGFLELIGELERRYSVVLAFDDVDADDLTQVGPLSRYVVSAPLDAGAVGAAPPVDVPSASATITPPSPLTSPRAGVVRGGIGRCAAACQRFVVRARDKGFSVLVSGSFAAYGQRSVIQLPTRLTGEGAVAIGAGVFVGAGSWIQVIGEPEAVVIEIGDGTAIAGHCVLSAVSGIRIGRDVSFARGVYISDVAHLYDDVSRPVLDQGTTDGRPIEIGDGAWIGENAVVLPGVRIGKGAVVSANSVVARDVADHTLVAGSPARVIRSFSG